MRWNQDGDGTWWVESETVLFSESGVEISIHNVGPETIQPVVLFFGRDPAGPAQVADLLSADRCRNPVDFHCVVPGYLEERAPFVTEELQPGADFSEIDHSGVGFYVIFDYASAGAEYAVIEVVPGDE